MTGARARVYKNDVQCTHTVAVPQTTGPIAAFDIIFTFLRKNEFIFGIYECVL